MLVLLIIFMVAAPMMTQGMAVNLPTGAARAAGDGAADLRHHSRHVLAASASCRSTTKRSGSTSCRSAMKQVMLERTDKSVFVRGDGAVTYQDLVFVIDKLKEGRRREGRPAPTRPATALMDAVTEILIDRSQQADKLEPRWWSCRSSRTRVLIALVVCCRRAGDRAVHEDRMVMIDLARRRARAAPGHAIRSPRSRFSKRHRMRQAEERRAAGAGEARDDRAGQDGEAGAEGRGEAGAEEGRSRSCTAASRRTGPEVKAGHRARRDAWCGDSLRRPRDRRRRRRCGVHGLRGLLLPRVPGHDGAARAAELAAEAGQSTAPSMVKFTITRDGIITDVAGRGTEHAVSEPGGAARGAADAATAAAAGGLYRRSPDGASRVSIQTMTLQPLTFSSRPASWRSPRSRWSAQQPPAQPPTSPTADRSDGSRSSARAAFRPSWRSPASSRSRPTPRRSRPRRRSPTCCSTTSSYEREFYMIGKDAVATVPTPTSLDERAAGSLEAS